MDKKTTQLWEFSCKFYNREAIADACLMLQDQYGFDVNLLLYCLWSGGKFGELDELSLNRAMEFSEHWRTQVVQPLRDTRTVMKSALVNIDAQMREEFEQLRSHIKNSELQAERFQQLELERQLAVGESEMPAGPTGEKAMLNNLYALADAMQRETDSQMTTAFQFLVHECMASSSVD